MLSAGVIGFSRRRAGFAHGFSFQFEGVTAVQQSVQDGIGERRVADRFVPLRNGELAGHER